MSKKGIIILEILNLKNDLDSTRIKLDNLKVYLDFKGFNIGWTNDINRVISLLSTLSNELIKRIDKEILK